MTRRLILTAALPLILAACGQGASTSAVQPAQVPASLPTPAVPGAPQTASAPAQPAPVQPSAPLPPQAQAINDASFGAPAATPPAAPAPDAKAADKKSPGKKTTAKTATATAAAGDPLLIKASVLLSRAHFSPGSIDGRDGSNLRAALKAYQSAHNLTPDGKLNAEVWQALSADAAPAATTYVITPQDVAGPFIAAVPVKFEAQAELPAMSFTSAREALAERFHMSEKLLQALNPDVDFTQAGAAIVVLNAQGAPLAATVQKIEVDKSVGGVRAYGADGALLAVFPATIGSTDRPSPAGTWKVKGVAKNPPYEYDPARLTFGKIGHKLEIKPGPNNPVGVVWIDLSKDTYGIHGSPDPDKIGKAQSHGCVRLTNWDAQMLADAVKPGTVVDFVKSGAKTGARTKA